MCFGARCRVPVSGEPFLMFYKTAKMTASGRLQGGWWTTAGAVPATPMGGKRQQGMAAGETAVAMKRNDKIGQTVFDKQGEACPSQSAGEDAAGWGGGERIGRDCGVCP